MRATALLSLTLLILTISGYAGTQTIRGYVRLGALPAANLTFLYEKTSQFNDAKSVTTDHLGNYEVVFDNCVNGWPGVLYNPRMILASGDTLLMSGFHNNFLCPDLTWNISIPAGTQLQSGIRYGAGETCPFQSVGRPVNVTNGNMWLKHTDYLLPGVGGGLQVERTYNSVVDVPGIFGQGWSSDYDTKLLTVLSQQNQALIQLDLGNGQISNFVNVGGPVYFSATNSIHAEITVDGSEYLLAWKDGRTFRFSATGQMIWRKDRNGNQTTFSHNGSGHLTSVTDPHGRILTLVPNSNGRVTQVSDSLGVVASYDYDQTGEFLTKVTFADGSEFAFEYLTVGNRTYLATVKDALNNILETHDYDSEGRATTSEIHGGAEKYELDYSNWNQTHPYTVVSHRKNLSDPMIETKYYFDRSKGRPVITKIDGDCGCGGGSEQTEYFYSNTLNLVKQVDALGREVDYTYDSNGNRLTETDFLGTQQWTYNSLGQILTYRDRVSSQNPNNPSSTVNSYDSGGNLLSTTDALNHTTTLTYTSIGQLATVTDARNNTTAFSWDVEGRLDEVTDPNNKTTSFAYDARARLTGITNALNQTTNFEYDLNNRLKKVVYPDANFAEYAYDLAGRRTGVTDPRGNTTTFGYDGAYRVISVTDPLNHARAFGYDLMSNLVSQTDALGNVTNFEYDDFNRLKKIIYPEPSAGAPRLEETLTFDAVGNIKTRVDTANRTTAYDYDSADRMIKITDALNNDTEFEYNARAQMTKVTDALNQEYTFAYDPVGRVLSKTRAGTSMTFEYDAVGNRTKKTDYAGTVTNYTYDNLNRITQNSLGTFTYDDLSRMITATNSNGTVSFSYDSRGRVHTTTDVYNRMIEYGYDPNGNRTLLKLGGINYTGYGYDAANRLTSLSDLNWNEATTLAYDNADRLTSMFRPRGVTRTLDYDGMSRLTKLRDESKSILQDKDYSYNIANQISQISEPGRVRVFTYDNLDRLTAVADSLNGNESYAYDSVGNRTASHLSSSYTYQPFNRLTSTQDATYTYNANGSMTSRSDADGDHTFNHDSDGRLVLAYDDQFNMSEFRYDALGRRIYTAGSFQFPQEFTFDGHDVLVSNPQGGSATKYQNGPGIDNKLSVTHPGGSGATYYLRDHIGTTFGTVGTSFSQGPIMDAFGGPSGDFTGREYDNFTGLYYYRARMYDQNLGRFTSEDPIGFEGGDVNLYGYVHNRPTMFRDPLGLQPSGGDVANWLDSNVYYARDSYTAGSAHWYYNGTLDTNADLISSVYDPLRLGSGIGYAMYDGDATGSQRAFAVGQDILRATVIGSLAAGFASRAMSAGFRSAPAQTTQACPIVDKFSRDPKSLMDQMVVDAAKRGAGDKLPIKLNDPRFKGMDKFSYGETSAAGIRSEVHYVRDPVTGNTMDFKFKHHAERYR